MAFENHVHALKRSFPLKNYTKVKEGTVFIGDGRWGASLDECEQMFPDLLPVNLMDFHAWILHVRADHVYGEAIGMDGRIIDSFTLNVPPIIQRTNHDN